MPIDVKLNDVIDALDSASDEHSYYLDRRTGEIILVTDDDVAAAEEDRAISRYPEWQQDSIMRAGEAFDDSENYLSLPDKFDIHEYAIMQDFCLSLKDRGVRDRRALRAYHRGSPGARAGALAGTVSTRSCGVAGVTHARTVRSSTITAHSQHTPITQ